MLHAYNWAFVKPMRKLYYNFTITFVSVVVAVVIGGIELLGLIGDKMRLSGAFWDGIGVFVASWVLSVAIYRWRGFDRVEIKRAAGEP